MTGVRRRVVRAIGRQILRLLPGPLEAWGWAIRHEIDAIDDDSEALGFALDALRGAVAQSIAYHLTGGSTDMKMLDGLLRRPRLIGIVCALGAAGLGLAYLAMAAAPTRYLAVNGAALVIGLVVLGLIGRGTGAARLPGGVTLALGSVLLATALLGDAQGGASRWLMLGPLFVQPSLIILPLMVVGFAQARPALATAGMMIAALALALQPDRAMAAMLVAGLATLAVFKADRHAIVALATAAVGFAVTIARPDTLPAAAHVDRILYSAFDVHPLAGLAVLGGSALLLVPAIAAIGNAEDRAIHAVFGMVWLAAIAAAALGNYPTPLVGYGGSAVIGYVLSLAMLPRAVRAGSGTRAPDTETAPAPSPSNQPSGLCSAA